MAGVLLTQTLVQKAFPRGSYSASRQHHAGGGIAAPDLWPSYSRKCWGLRALQPPVNCPLGPLGLPEGPTGMATPSMAAKSAVASVGQVTCFPTRAEFSPDLKC